MEGLLRDLLRIRATNLRTNEAVNTTHGFTQLGVAFSIPDLDPSTGEIFIWHAPNGILPITRSELIRFGMDAPNGMNFILSERTVQSDCDSIDTFEFRIFGPEDISNWIGRAILSGDLTASVKAEELGGDNKYSLSHPIDSEIRVLKSLIDFATWSTQRGMDGFSSSPVLLNARLWIISGELQGPNGEGELRSWTIVEDPWSQVLSSIEEIEKLQKAPILRIAEPPNDFWLAEDKVNDELAKITEERRRGNSGESSLSGSVRSMLLQKWILNFDKSSISNSRILIPGWLIHLESDKILHGRNGRLYDSP